jgi:hypothetical protein
MTWQMRLLSTLVVSDEEGDGPQLRRQEMESLGHRRFVEMAAQTQPKVSMQPRALPVPSAHRRGGRVSVAH